MQGVSSERCERCHTEEAKQQAAGSGLHGALVAATACANCHPEHQGRAFDTAAAGLQHFDHAATGFELARHIQDYGGAVIECQACHGGTGFEFAVAGCVGCHSEADRPFMLGHLAAFGDGCLACHDGIDRMATFDHAATALPLEGAHAAADCTDCHQIEGPRSTISADCAGCHAEPNSHAGVLGDDCAACHTAEAWTPARLAGQAFAHGATQFALDQHGLDFAGQPLTCRGCHTTATSDPASLSSDTGPACAACHTEAEPVFMAGHIQTFGLDCAGCHDGLGNMADFDHAQVFSLDGAHAPLECAACHSEQRFRGTPSQCAGCHAEPEVHAGAFGLECAACHTTAAWLPAALRAHTFPLDHGEEGPLACATCHAETYMEYTCYGCHEHEPRSVAREHAEEGIQAAELTDCAACHPSGEEE
jgi:hypothetical protein